MAPMTSPPNAKLATMTQRLDHFPRARSSDNIQPSASTVTGRSIMCACRSLYKKVNRGNSVIGSTSPGEVGMMRLGFQYHSPQPYGSGVPERVLPNPVTDQARRSVTVDPINGSCPAD